MTENADGTHTLVFEAEGNRYTLVGDVRAQVSEWYAQFELTLEGTRPAERKELQEGGD